MDDVNDRSCTYCVKQIQIENDDYLTCLECHGDVHIKCLHLSCTPGDLFGDIFFDFTCANCVQLQNEEAQCSKTSSTLREKFVRQSIPWLMVITLALYNLSIKSKGLSRNGYFHWSTHIIGFISKNWEYLFESSRRKRKNWMGSISGALSHNNPDFFVSGQEEFNETGWWKLAHANYTPKQIFKIYEQKAANRAKIRADKRPHDDSNVSHVNENTGNKRRHIIESDDESQLPTDSCSRTIPYMGRQPKVLKKQLIAPVEKLNKVSPQQPLNSVQSSLMDFLAENLSQDDFTIFNNLSHITPEPFAEDSGNSNGNIFEYPSHTFDIPTTSSSMGGMDGKFKSYYEHQIQQTLSDGGESKTFYYDDDDDNDNERETLTNGLAPVEEGNNDDDDVDDEFKPRIVQVTNFQEISDETIQEGIENNHVLDTNCKKEETESDEEQNGVVSPKKTISSDETEKEKDLETTAETLPLCKPSLFTKSVRRNWPWLVEKSVDEEEEVILQNENSMDMCNKRLTMMSLYEEQELLQKLRKIFSLETKCNINIPSYIRRFYRKLCVREWKRDHSKKIFNLDEQVDGREKYLKYDEHIIDRYQLIASTAVTRSRKSFYARIAGSFQYEFFESPYTQRTLHPFIYKNKECFPVWLKLMCELQYTVNGIIPTRSTIDYCYVRPNHIAAVNALLQSSFWPGIDMTECLSYPDYSVVALYKKLVIGCGFLVPDVGFNEAYISFMAVRPGWQRCGIGTFMLYHLIQTCMDKDITLHVSATNPAIVLYQKFGFKIEEVIINFYDKYLPLDSKHSRNAFLLRLMR